MFWNKGFKTVLSQNSNWCILIQMQHIMTKIRIMPNRIKKIKDSVK